MDVWRPHCIIRRPTPRRIEYVSEFTVRSVKTMRDESAITNRPTGSSPLFWFALGVVMKTAVLFAWHVSRQSLALQVFLSMDLLGSWIAGVISRMSGDSR